MQQQEQAIPVLRFPKFNNDWDKKPLGAFYEFKSTNSFSRDQLNYDNGEVFNIHYGDIHKKFKTQFKLEYEEVPFINDDIPLDKISDDKYCMEGDLVFADASEDYDDIGKAIEVISLNNKKALAGLHTLLARRLNDDISVGFGGYLFGTGKVRKQIKVIAQGTKVLGISAKEMEKIQLSISNSKEEQTKIAAFLGTVDKKITQLQKKKDLLEDYKKGCMQQLFSQELRFTDDNGAPFPDWEEIKVGEIASFKKGKGISKADIKEDGVNKCIRYGELYTEYNAFISNVKSYTDTPLQGSVLSKANDMLMPTSDVTPTGLATASALDEEGVILGGDILIIRSKQLSNRYFSYYVTARKNQIMRLVTGVTVYHIYGSDLATLRLNLPSMNEQEKIANFLSAVDDKIALVAEELDKAKTFKKGLLQQMFV